MARPTSGTLPRHRFGIDVDNQIHMVMPPQMMSSSDFSVSESSMTVKLAIFQRLSPCSWYSFSRLRFSADSSPLYGREEAVQRLFTA